MSQNKRVVEQAFKMMEQDAWAVMGEIVDANLECVMPGGVTLNGREAMSQMLQAYKAAFRDLKHEVITSAEAGEHIAVEVRATGTMTGPLQTPQGELPPTGKKLSLRSCDFITVRGGKITHWHVYFDNLEFMTQLGLLPQKS